MGKPDFEAVRETDDDPEFFCQAMGIKRIPSPEILRQRMDEIGRSMRSTLLWENTNLLVKNHVSPSKISCGFIPVDMDVTPCDNSKTKKEGVSRTYKGCDGYAPMMAYFGREGYLINCELRKGSQHCQKHTPEFLRETIDACRRVTKEPLLFRLDSGNDSTENIGPTHPMRHPVKRRRIGMVIKNLVMMACHITRHARRTKLGLGRSNIWRKTFQKVYLSFSCL